MSTLGGGSYVSFQTGPIITRVYQLQQSITSFPSRHQLSNSIIFVTATPYLLRELQRVCTSIFLPPRIALLSRRPWYSNSRPCITVPCNLLIGTFGLGVRIAVLEFRTQTNKLDTSAFSDQTEVTPITNLCCSVHTLVSPSHKVIILQLFSGRFKVMVGSMQESPHIMRNMIDIHA